MPTPGAAELLDLWDRAALRHPIDRAVLFAAGCLTELPPDRIADLPLGAINQALLHLRDNWFGRVIEAYLDCPECGERLELTLDTDSLLTSLPGQGELDLELAGFRFRPPTSRDLAAVAEETDVECAAIGLLQRCCIERPVTANRELAELLPEVE